MRLEPETPEALAAALAESARERRVTVLRGGGTKSGWGRPPSEVGLTLGTARLNRLIAHRHGDMTATVQAGMRLADFNRELGRHGQWLPIESAFDEATIGGVVATNDCGPMRHRSGTPRDLLIGITLALTDGRLVKAGGHVVKNVAGYDLGKLVSGSFGSFAAIVDATFKLMPLTRASATLSVGYDHATDLARDAAALAASQLEPAAFDVRVGAGRLKAAPAGEQESGGLLQAAQEPGPHLLVRFASSPAATDAQVAGASALLTGRIARVTGDDETALWREQVRAPWRETGTVVRLSWLPSNLAKVLDLVRGHALTGRVMGTGLLRLEGDAGAHAGLVERLRANPDVRHVVVLRASPELKRQVDVWGPPVSSAAATRALKQMFDPAGILNAGRGPV